MLKLDSRRMGFPLHFSLRCRVLGAAGWGRRAPRGVRPASASPMVALASEVKDVAALSAPEIDLDDVRQRPVGRQCRERHGVVATCDLDEGTVFEVCSCHANDLFKLTERANRHVLAKIPTSGAAHSSRITAAVGGLQRITPGRLGSWRPFSRLPASYQERARVPSHARISTDWHRSSAVLKRWS